MAKRPRSAKRAKSTAGTAKAARAARTAGTSEPGQHVIDCALMLAAERGWRHTGLGDIAAASKLSLAELYGHYRSKEAILTAFVRRIDREVLSAGPAEGESARDRLFDILMRRFEALRPHKKALEAILRERAADPMAILCSGLRLKRSMTWMLEAAGIESSGLLGRARAKGLALVYLATMPIWLADDSADLSRTMAALDKRLRRAEHFASFCGSLNLRRHGREEGREARAA